MNKLQTTRKKQELLCLPIPVDHRIAIALWRLGTNVEYRIISHLIGVGISSVCMIMHQVCKAIVGMLGPWNIGMPQGEIVQILVDGFLQWWQFPRCAGAIDWSHVPILDPSRNPKDYFNRKGFHSILRQGVIDHHCRFSVNKLYNNASNSTPKTACDV